MKPVFSLPWPGELVTGTYPQPDDPPTLPQPISLASILILSSHLLLGLLGVFSPHACHNRRLSHPP